MQDESEKHACTPMAPEQACNALKLAKEADIQLIKQKTIEAIRRAETKQPRG